MADEAETVNQRSASGANEACTLPQELRPPPQYLHALQLLGAETLG